MIDAVPTGRARCRGCKQLIERGAPRLVVYVFVRPGRVTKLVRHPACVDGALAADIVRTHGGVKGVLAGKRASVDAVTSARAVLSERVAALVGG